MKKQKKVGIALGSGGIRGLAHIGVLKTLLRHHIPIAAIAGSSIGAWMGAHYALFQDVEMLEALNIGRKREKLDALFEPTWRGGLIGGEKTKKLLGQWLHDATFAEMHIPLAVVATDINKREVCVFTQGAVVPAVQASMAIPGLFKPVSYQGRVLVDGGVSNPVPSDIVRTLGVDVVIAVNLYRIPEDPTHVDGDVGLLEVTRRSREIARYILAKNAMTTADIAIEPPVEPYAGWSRYFRHDVGAEIVALGEKEAEKVIPKIQKLLE